ncbi:MAG: low molecular weight protein arginine phosphatase [Elusimicrobia bacterium]|nr:low molecular weight protein arginine phosphatase [Elusimicrobiota bacterium]
MNLLFVCTGNTCRSPMAEYLFKKMLREAHREDVQVRSCGVAASPLMQIPDPVVRLMKAEGVDISRHRSQPLTVEEVHRADVILAMDQSHRAVIEALYPEAQSKTFLLKTYVQAAGVEGREGPSTSLRAGSGLEGGDICDPIGQTDDGYRACLKEITTCLKRLQAQLPPPPETSGDST